MRVAVSWSGGKDGALAADLAREAGHDVVAHVSVVEPGEARVRAHGTPAGALQAQARALGRELELREAGWDDYGEAFRDAAAALRDEAGIEALVFGDVSLDEHRRWGERVAGSLDLEALYPMWGWDHADVVAEALERGFDAVVVSARDPLGEEILGERLTRRLAERIAEQGASPSGEDGSFHTFVRDGPGFREGLEVEFGDIERGEEYVVVGHEAP